MSWVSTPKGKPVGVSANVVCCTMPCKFCVGVPIGPMSLV